jgi:hypothetical protein
MFEKIRNWWIKRTDPIERRRLAEQKKAEAMAKRLDRNLQQNKQK